MIDTNRIDIDTKKFQIYAFEIFYEIISISYTHHQRVAHNAYKPIFVLQSTISRRMQVYQWLARVGRLPALRNGWIIKLRQNEA